MQTITANYTYICVVVANYNYLILGAVCTVMLLVCFYVVHTSNARSKRFVFFLEPRQIHQPILMLVLHYQLYVMKIITAELGNKTYWRKKLEIMVE